MRVRAFGRIVVWEGASLWVLGTRPGEAYPRTASHRHHAVQVTLALRGSVKLQAGGDAYAGKAAAVAPDVLHAFEADGVVAHLFVEPESRAGRALTGRLFRRAPLVGLDGVQLADTTARLASWYERPDRTDAQLIALGRALVDELAEGPEPEPTDARVERILRWAAGQLRHPVSLVDAARLVGLSPGRTRHLFVEQTGLAFRTYLLWLRLEAAVQGYGRAESLTEAALGAGFSDAAHFSRTFRRMFGITADSLALHGPGATDPPRLPPPPPSRDS